MDKKADGKVGDVDRSSGVQKSNPVSTGGNDRTWIVGGKVHSFTLKKLTPSAP